MWLDNKIYTSHSIHSQVENLVLPNSSLTQGHASKPLHTGLTPRYNENTALPSHNPNSNDDQPPQEVMSFVGEDELRRRLYESSKCLVSEGEKNVTMALDLKRIQENLRSARAENEQIRLVLLHGINGGTPDANSYANVALNELLRIRLQEFEDGGFDSSSVNYSSSRSNKKLVKGHSETKSMSSNQCQQNFGTGTSISTRNDDTSSGDRLRSKLKKMNGRSQRDREIKHTLQRQVEEANGNVDALSDHIEKLMVHLKHEAITKAKALSENGKHLKEIELLKKRNHITENRNTRKDRAISELKEGGKVLEDQLGLMDEKYMELRMKLDWTRMQTERVLKKKDDEVKDLRSKLMLLKDLMADKGKKKVRRTGHS